MARYDFDETNVIVVPQIVLDSTPGGEVWEIGLQQDTPHYFWSLSLRFFALLIGNGLWDREC